MTIPRLLSAFTALVLFMLLFFGAESTLDHRSHKLFWNLGHIPLFMLLSYFLITPPSPLAVRSFKYQCLAVACFTFLLGGLIEVAQLGVGRNMDAADLARNGMGAFLGLTLLSPGRLSLNRFYRHSLQALALALLTIAGLPFTMALYDERQAIKDWPVLANFEQAGEINRWSTTGDAHISIDSTVARDGIQSLKVELGTSRYAGASLDFFPEDWSGQQGLSIHLYNPTAKLLIVTCRIHDKQHSQSIEQQANDRFNQSYELQQGWNKIMIKTQDLASAPSERLMDIRRIDRLEIFVSALASPTTLYIDHIYLATAPVYSHRSSPLSGPDL